MNLLIVGIGSGSWAMRGEQLGAALGARVSSFPRDSDIRWADLVVLVKRAGRQWASLVRKHDKPIVWDAVDFWRQPTDNSLSERDARDLLAREIAAIRPVLTIGATQAMADACEGAYLPHHARLDLKPTAVRRTVEIVAYDGNPAYLGRWDAAIAAACQRRGWGFAINPPDLSMADILVALRDGPWDGWMCREWKSGVKLGNAIVAERPVIMQDTAAAREIAPMGTVIERFDELDAAFDTWAPTAARESLIAQSLKRAQDFDVRAVAAQYRGILEQAVMACAA